MNLQELEGYINAILRNAKEWAAGTGLPLYQEDIAVLGEYLGMNIPSAFYKFERADSPDTFKADGAYKTILKTLGSIQKKILDGTLDGYIEIEKHEERKINYGKEQKIMAMSELKWRLLLLELAKAGYREAWYSDANGIVYTDPADKRMPKIHDNGDIVYGTEYDHLVVSEIQPIVDRVNEQVAAWEKSQPIAFNDTSKFRIIAEYNNVVLAARDDGNIGHGLHFTTWEYNRDRTVFDDGHYTTDYESAKV